MNRKYHEKFAVIPTACFIAGLLLVLGCLEAGTASAVCEGENCERTTAAREGYPGFGTGVGNIIEPLEFVDIDGEPYNLRSVYQDGRNQVLLITTSAGWCTACIEEQSALESLYGDYNERGVEIIVAVFQKGDYSAADANFAKQWKRRYELSYPVVADPSFVMQDYYPGRDTSVTPIMLVIDVQSMTILERFVGYDDIVMRALIDDLLTRSSE